jgi:lipoprotein-anchoring transpeptidase ErfK/SrfK
VRRFLAAGFFCFLFFFLASSANAQGISTTEKLITVDTGSQTLNVWQNGAIVHSTKVSTGMKLTPTVRGSFKVQRKIPMHDMRGPSPYKNIYPSGRYHIKNVPHSLYFYQGYAIHGAYWHNNFGRVASHGCVNVPLASAEWIFNFADVGTRVEVF